MSISAAVLMKDERLGETLARELARRERSVKFFVIDEKNTEDFDVYISDYFTSYPDKTCQVQIENISLDKLRRQVLDIALKNPDCSRHPWERNLLTLGFRSNWGGSGVTASAIGTARLAAEAGEKILFLNLNKNKGFQAYLEDGVWENLRNPRELEFCLETGRAFSLESFVKRDISGVSYLDGAFWNFEWEKKSGRFMEACLEAGYGCLAADLGAENGNWCQKVISVHFQDDRRYVAKAGQNGQNEFAIEKDFHSFSVSDGKIEMKLDGAFGERIRDITKRVLQG